MNPLYTHISGRTSIMKRATAEYPILHHALFPDGVHMDDDVAAKLLGYGLSISDGNNHCSLVNGALVIERRFFSENELLPGTVEKISDVLSDVSLEL